MVTKNEFIKQLQPLRCSICLDEYNSEHVPVELSCGHIFGDHCIVEQTEIRTPNNNRCPLCRKELFEQEDFDATGYVLYDSDEALIEFDDDDDDDDDTDEDDMAIDEEQYQEALAALADIYGAGERTDDPASNAFRATTAASRRERLDRRQEFREHTAQRRETDRLPAPKSPRRTRTSNEIGDGSDSGSDGSEYEPQDDTDSDDEREENRAYKLLPGEHDTTLPTRPATTL